VFGIVQRGGRVKAIKVDKVGVHLIPIVKENVDVKVKIFSDQYQAYKTLYWLGYSHESVHHANKEYVRGNVHTQNIDNFWGNMKRGIRGVYRHVDPSYLQACADKYAFRYSRRNDFQPMFWALLGRVENSD
jgi:transposase